MNAPLLISFTDEGSFTPLISFFPAVKFSSIMVTDPFSVFALLVANVNPSRPFLNNVPSAPACIRRLNR